uniref:Uncharacterized protein n=1 Tax=Lotus japonicus TaxID=34305 RepID=I3SAP9_LOTJA|nr:unknown [Lotus japonicus]
MPKSFMTTLISSSVAPICLSSTNLSQCLIQALHLVTRPSDKGALILALHPHHIHMLVYLLFVIIITLQWLPFDGGLPKKMKPFRRKHCLVRTKSLLYFLCNLFITVSTALGENLFPSNFFLNSTVVSAFQF